MLTGITWVLIRLLKTARFAQGVNITVDYPLGELVVGRTDCRVQLGVVSPGPIDDRPLTTSRNPDAMAADYTPVSGWIENDRAFPRGVVTSGRRNQLRRRALAPIYLVSPRGAWRGGKNRSQS